MRKIFLLFILFLYSFSFSQENYKYVIVPKRFEFFKEENKYNVNFITKAFFEKEGFQVFYDTDNFPEELAGNRCLALFVSVNENNNMFVTKIIFEIKDCFGKTVQISDEGTSREKDFKKAYNESFRNALSSMSGKLNFNYPEVDSKVVTSTTVENKSTEEVIPANIEEATPFKANSNQLFAIPTTTGYKLVDSTPKSIILIHKTSLSDVFIAEKDNFKGVLLKKNSGWFFEYDFDGKVYSEKVEVKF